MPVSAAFRQEVSAQIPRLAISRSGRIAKRVIDIVGASVMLVLLAPLICFLVVWIKLHDGGPALFRRRVVGMDGEFDAFKLRTMRVDADEILHRDNELRQQFEINYKLKDDPRVTSIGAALRRTKLDELPQLWNVLKGEMSLVGPRMISSPELKKYGKASRLFTLMKPGLTGYWQVYGNQESGYDKRVSMDLFYAEHWSLWFDLKILIRTPLRILHS
jgi:lipopolysaccharide/colanic/teichoic acid biosynthesis glycosyltransferase